MTEIVKREFTTGRNIQFQEEIYENKWKIANWMKIQQSRELIEKQKFTFETGRFSQVKAKWEVGMLIRPSPSELHFTNVTPYCKLLHVYGTTSEIEAAMSLQYSLDCTNNMSGKYTTGKKVKPNDVIYFEHPGFGYWFNKPREECAYYLDADGELTVVVTLTLQLPATMASTPGTREFSPFFVSKLQHNFSTIINDPSSADLKLVTSDGKELLAHKIVLNAQCPIFASMFRSQFSEDTTGVVDIKDISGKTMDILLRFFYTGELLPTWCDPDTIVEFTYAAGKYQMEEVLEMLDSVLGTTDEEETSSFDLELLNITNKLELKNAQERLWKRVVRLISETKNADELLAIFRNAPVETNIDLCGK